MSQKYRHCVIFVTVGTNDPPENLPIYFTNNNPPLPPTAPPLTPQPPFADTDIPEEPSHPPTPRPVSQESLTMSSSDISLPQTPNSPNAIVSESGSVKNAQFEQTTIFGNKDEVENNNEEKSPPPGLGEPNSDQEPQPQIYIHSPTTGEQIHQKETGTDDSPNANDTCPTTDMSSPITNVDDPQTPTESPEGLPVSSQTNSRTNLNEKENESLSDDDLADISKLGQKANGLFICMNI